MMGLGSIAIILIISLKPLIDHLLFNTCVKRSTRLGGAQPVVRDLSLHQCSTFVSIVDIL